MGTRQNRTREPGTVLTPSAQHLQARVDRRIDLAGSLVIATLGATIFGNAVAAPSPPTVYDLFGPMGLPALLGASLAIAGGWQSYVTWSRLRRLSPFGVTEGSEDEEGYPASTGRVLLLMGGSAAYVAVLPMIGFILATPPAIVAALWALEFRRLLPALLAGAAFTILGFLVFNQVLSVPLPLGPVGGVLAELGLIDRVR